MDDPVREYIKMVAKLWGKHIAGPTAALFAIILPFVGLAIGSGRTVAIWLDVIPLLIAVILIWPAQYEVWKSAEVKIYELRGRPQVSLVAVLRVGETVDVEFIFRFMNASDDTATNVVLSPIVTNHIVVNFSPIPAITNTPQGAYLSYDVRLGEEAVVSQRERNKDLLLIWGNIARSGQDRYNTTLSFSNFD